MVEKEQVQWSETRWINCLEQAPHPFFSNDNHIHRPFSKRTWPGRRRRAALFLEWEWNCGYFICKRSPDCERSHVTNVGCCLRSVPRGLTGLPCHRAARFRASLAPQRWLKHGGSRAQPHPHIQWLLDLSFPVQWPEGCSGSELMEQLVQAIPFG